MVNFIVNDFSRTYIKIVRDRESPNYVFTTVFNNLLRLMAPITPFITEYIYNDMKNDSVHMARWPKPDKKLINENLENDMKIVDAVYEVANSMRKEKSIKLKWPLPLIVIDTKIKDARVRGVIKNLCNVKDVIFGKEESLEKKEFEHGAIYMDLNVIKDEALLREVIRKIQDMRKRSGMKISDRIAVKLENCDLLKKFENEIKKEVGAKDILFGENDGEIIDFEERTIKIKIERV
jgi:valyl-tRNA synthetase